VRSGSPAESGTTTKRELDLPKISEKAQTRQA
jgi:hypothetical protein